MIQFGIDIVLQQNPSWKKQRIALVTNYAATTYTKIPSRKSLVASSFNITKLFSPEHGLDIKGADGAKIEDGKDSLTHLPVISLYNEKLAPTEEDLKDIDIVLFDIPDIGCRFYTYLWTMTYLLQACANYKKKIIILDRPNPISGNLSLAEGNLLDEKNCSSFIGRWAIPLRHSCTLGELASYFNREKNMNASLEIITCKNWNRNMFQPDWEIDFIATSPAIKNIQSALLYPGLGLLEATNISEGRGTQEPFILVGAPWLDSNLLMNNMDSSAVTISAATFIPTDNKYAGEICNGIKYHVANLNNFHSLTNGLLLIKLIKDNYPSNFKWKTYPTNVNPSGKNHLDKLLGVYKSEDVFELPIAQFNQQLKELTNTENWQKKVSPYLLY